MKFVSSIMAVMLAASISMGATFRSLPHESMADIGATHVAVITYSDLASATNLAAGTYVVSNICPVAAKQSVEMVAMILVAPFYDSATNGHSSTTVTVGDGTSATAFMTSTEMNTNGTAVYVKFGTSPAALTTSTQTNIIAVTFNTTNCWVNGGTNQFYLVTNITATAETQTRVTGITDLNNNTGTKVYTSANDLKFTFTGTSSYAMQDLDAGEVRFYFRIKDAAVANP